MVKSIKTLYHNNIAVYSCCACYRRVHKRNSNNIESNIFRETHGPYDLTYWSGLQTASKDEWKLYLDQNIVTHKPFCNSDQIVTQFGLVHNLECVNSQNLVKFSTGKSATKLSQRVQLWTPELCTEYVKNVQKITIPKQIWYPIVSSSVSPIEIGFK